MANELDRTTTDFLSMSMRRIHGRKAATFLFGIALFFCLLLISFQSDLLPPDALEYLDIMPPAHVKNILARHLAASTAKDPNLAQSFEWESTYDIEKNDYKACALNQPRDRPEQGCTVDKDTKIPYCQLNHLKIDSTKILGSAPGGESLDSVMGRDEDLEFLRYLPGAFSTPSTISLSPIGMNRDYWYYLLDVFMSLDINRKMAQKCDIMLPGVSLLITRYEYVDMYHTLKDWWNAFMVLPDGQKANRVIFLDSHAQGYLDSVWKDLFGEEVMYINQLENEATCLEKALFVPPGYSSVLWPWGRKFHGNRCVAMSKAFVEFFVEGYGFENITMQKSTILILDQAPHVIHPRSKIDGVSYDNSLLLDMQAKLLDETDATSVQVVDLKKLSFRSRLKLVRQAHILLGNHGSDMTHCMLLQAGAACLEITRDESNFAELARWRPDLFHKMVWEKPNLMKYEIVPEVKDIFDPGWDKKEGVNRYPPAYYEMQFDEKNSWNETSNDGLLLDDMISNSNLQDINPIVDSQHVTTYDDTKDYLMCLLNRPMPRPEHGCQADLNTKIPYCIFRNMRIDVSKIDAPLGGEDLDSVMGRDEGVEFPKYRRGAFSTEKAPEIPLEIDKTLFYYLSDVIKALSVGVTEQGCAVTVSKPTLFLTRYDYVDSFHTLADWWNTFFVLPNDLSDVEIVFLDSHANGMFDPVWREVFGKVEFVKQLPQGGVCFDNAIFVPSGYSSVLSLRRIEFKGNPCPAMTVAFVDFFIKKYDLENEKMEHGLVTIVDHVPHVVHPRSDIRKEERTIPNLERVKECILRETNATAVALVRLDDIPFVEQLRILRRSHILMGHAVAGISHLIFLQDGAHALEFHRSGHIGDIAMWKPNITHRTVDIFTGNEISEMTLNYSVVPAVNYALNNGEKAR